jgi:DNA-binding SARP family transcriptional activator/predicted ATPase
MEVVVGERPVDLGPRMPRAVLALLLMHVNRVVSLDAVVDHLWGDSPPPTATAAVQGYVSGLRRALEPDRPPRAPAQLLVTRAPGYVLRAPVDAVDGARFEALTRAGMAELAKGRPQAAAASLRAGLALWRGAPYADLAFESFVQVESGRLLELRAAAGEALAEAEPAMGDSAAALLDLERLVATSPLRDRGWELLALAYYRSGRQTDALRALSRARSVLVEELGLDPGPALRRLEGDILVHAPSLDWTPPADETAPAEPAEPAEAAAAVAAADAEGPIEGLLVGRTAELARMTEALDGVVAGANRIVVLSGEPGIGKTRLAQELCRSATARGALVAWGYCHEAATAPPYWPWAQIVGALVRDGEPPAVRSALGGGAAQLAQIVPEVKDVAGVELAPLPLTEPEVARGLLYEAVVGFLRRSAAARPLVLVIDDLHWADVASLQLLEVVCAGVRGAPVLLVCTYRELEARAIPPVIAAVAHLGRQAGVVRIAPGGLTEADVAVLVEEATGGAPPPGLAGTIRDRTEGNPFFVSELVALVGARARAAGAPGGDMGLVAGDIPAGVRDAIRARLARLPDDAVALLGVAAVIGRDFDLGLLAASTDVDEERVMDLLELAVLVGVVVDGVESPGGLRFSHSLVRETVYGSLPALRRARTHRRVGEALERLGPDDARLAELAHHFLEGVGAGTVDKAVSYAVALAGQATMRFAFELAERQLLQALELLATTPVGPARAACELDVQVQLSSVLAITQGYAAPDVGKALARAAELSREVGDPAKLLGSLRGAFVFALVGGRLVDADEIGRQLLDLGRRNGEPAFLAAGHRAVGTIACSWGRLADARRELEQGIVLADTLAGSSLANVVNDPSIGGRNKLAQALWLLGDLAGSDRVAAEALALAEAAGVVSLVDTLFMDGVRQAMVGDAAAVLRCADQALELVARHGFPLYDGSTRVIRGWARAVHGGSAAGVTEMGAALAAVGSTGARMYSPFFLGLLADACARVGRGGDALVAADQGLAEVDARGERFWQPELLRLRGVLLAWDGRTEDAEASLVVALEAARAQESAALVARAEASLARVRSGQGSAAGSDGGVGTAPAWLAP